MKYEMAIEIARELAAELGPVCVQVEIAGGLRRMKQDPHNIELVVRPRTAPLVTNFFGETVEDVSLLDERLEELVEAGRLERGRKNGPRYKQFKLLPSGLMFDLSVVMPPAQFGYLLAIRTGPAHFLQWLVTPRRKNGAMPSDLSSKNGALWRGESLIETPTEESYFAALGIPMVAPAERTPMWGRFREVEPEAV